MKPIFERLLLVCLWLFPAAGLSAATVETLAAALVSADPPVVIDLRPVSAYRKGHIPGAINIPMAGLDDRRLPPLGAVVAYGDGFGRQDTDRARAILAAKPGIDATILEGGYAAWESRSGVTTGGVGMTPLRPSTISYEELRAARAEEVVIYDLRNGSAQAADDGERPALRASAAGETTSDAGSAEDLTEHFPGVEIRRGEPQGDRSVPLRAVAAASTTPNPLLKRAPAEDGAFIVLIDDDHRTAEAVAQRLRAAGHRRVAVLAGGETILEFDGRAGSRRISGGKLTEAETAVQEDTTEATASE
ncbi:MAG: rhodanese-like domain-containing protein [Pseudomonadota bacterium]